MRRPWRFPRQSGHPGATSDLAALDIDFAAAKIAAVTSSKHSNAAFAHSAVRMFRLDCGGPARIPYRKAGRPFPLQDPNPWI